MNRNLSSSMTVLTGAALGAGLMYFLDPDRGAGRRERARDRAASALHIGSPKSGDAPPDQLLVERIRSRMGRHVSHPRAIEVTALEGRVTLKGPILAGEVQPMLSAIQLVRGIKGIENQLETHETPEGVPALQGDPDEALELEPHHWTRFLAGGIGAFLVGYGVRRRGGLGIPGALIGAGLLARGIGGRRHG